MKACLVLALIGLWPASVCVAQIEARVSVTDTDPAGREVTLGRDEPFYVRVKYEAGDSIRIWVRPYFNGEEVKEAKSNPSGIYSGIGHALGWFSLDGRSEVDEVRIRIGSSNPWREVEVARYPVRIAGTGLPAASRTTPAWVDTLRRETEVAQRLAFEKQMNEPASVGGTMLTSGIMLGMSGLLIAGFAAPGWALWRWRGGWRLAALVPAAIMGFVVLRIAVGVARDPASHNLWPFEIIMFGAVSVAIMAVLVIAHRVTRSRGG